MSATEVRAIVVADSAERLVIREMPAAAPRPGEVTVKVSTISLNRGETKRALATDPAGTRPGWDFAGTISETNGVANAPPAGTRVVGALPSGSWAERVNISAAYMAVVPNGVTDAQAATLPVAGLTALHGLRRGGLLLGRKVLVNGTTGGVGQMAIQLASAAGALVYSHVRREEQRNLVEAASTGGVAVGPTLEAARSFGPFDLIIDSIGGSALAAAMQMLRPKGICVTLGRSESDTVTFSLAGMYDAPNTSLQSMVLFEDLAATESAAHGLSILLRLVESGSLTPAIGVEAPWTEAAGIARRLIDRDFTGKAVLHVA